MNVLCGPTSWARSGKGHVLLVEGTKVAVASIRSFAPPHNVGCYTWQLVFPWAGYARGAEDSLSEAKRAAERAWGGLVMLVAELNLGAGI